MSELSKTIESIRKDFPLISGSNIAYLDNAATTQKPQAVLDAVNKYYQEMNANPFRGVYELSEIATESYENARKADRKSTRLNSSHRSQSRMPSSA